MAARCCVWCRVFVSCRVVLCCVARASWWLKSPQELGLTWEPVPSLSWDVGAGRSRRDTARCVASRRQGTGVGSVSISPIVTSVRTGTGSR